MKTLMITGGTGGLGSVVVRKLEREYRCVLLRHAEVDLEDEASVRAAVGRVEAPYGLVHLAGGWAGGAVSATDGETWRKMIGLNLNASFFVIREALQRLTRPGRIVAISSIATRDRLADSAAYTVSKTALNSLIEMTAAEVAGTGITANALLPATLDARLRESVAEAIVFLLSDAAANVNGALIPVTA